MTNNIKVKQDGSVPKRDWRKVEALPYGGPYADVHNGFNDHVDEDGNVFRVRFATFTEEKKITFQGKA